MISSEQVLAIFKEKGAFLEGHFLLSSGKHSSGYMQGALVLKDPVCASRLGEGIAEVFNDAGVTVVVGPAMGGIIIAHEVAKALSLDCLFTERVEGKMTFRRGFELKPQDKVLIVEDVITTGGSALEVLEYIQGLGVEVVGVSSVIDRSGGSAEFPVPYKALASVDLKVYDADDCDLCRQGLPLVKPGSRK